MTNSNYRNTLADDLKQKRNKKRIPIIQKSGKQLAQNMLEEAKNTDEYKEARIKKFVNLLENPEGKLTKQLDATIAKDIMESGEGASLDGKMHNFEGVDYYSEKSGIGHQYLNAIDQDNKVFFSYDKEKADKADKVLLYRDNRLYCSMMSDLIDMNSYLDKKKDQGKNIYIVSISSKASGVQNTDDLKKFFTTYKPLTDDTLSNRSGLLTERIYLIDIEDSLKYLNYMKHINELCKRNNIKKVYLLVGKFGESGDGKKIDNYHFLLEHGGFYKENGEYKYTNNPRTFDCFKNLNIQDKTPALQQALNAQIQVWKDFMPDVEIEMVRGEQCGSKIQGFDKTLDVNNSLLLVDGHISNFGRYFESMGGKFLSSSGCDLEADYIKEKLKNFFPQDSSFIDDFYEQNDAGSSQEEFFKKIFGENYRA